MSFFDLFRGKKSDAPAKISPQWNRRLAELPERTREVVRGFSEVNEHMTRAYVAAMTTSFDKEFVGTYGTANTEIFSYWYKIWARARSCAINTNYGKAIVRTYKQNVVGHDPFALTMRIGDYEDQPHPITGKPVKTFKKDDDACKQIEEWWREFCTSRNFTIRQNISAMEGWMQCVSEMVQIGSIIIRIFDDYPFNEFGFALDFLESDRLTPNYQGLNQEPGPCFGYPIRGSIERHPKYGFATAFHVLTRHPGEFVAQSYSTQGMDMKKFRERIPANKIIHLNNLRDRAEQDIGFTELEACVKPIYSNYQYTDALTRASIASACKPWVIEKNTPTGLTYSPSSEEYASLMGAWQEIAAGNLGSQGLKDGQNPVALQQQFAPGGEMFSPAMVKVLEWGLTMKVLDPKFPIEQAHEFRQDNDKQIAVAAGIGYPELTADFQNVGYIAGQLMFQPARNNYMIWQQHVLAEAVRPVFKMALTQSILMGKLPGWKMSDVDYLCQHHVATFRPKRWPAADPLRQAQATIMELNAFIKSPQQVQDELPDGKDIRDVLAEAAEAKQIKDAHGLQEDVPAPNTVKVQENIDGDGNIQGTEPPPKPGSKPPAKKNPKMAAAAPDKTGGS